MLQTAVPQVAIPLVLFSLCILGLFAVSISLWIRGLVGWLSGRAVLPGPEPRHMQGWGLVDLAFAFSVVIGLQFLASVTGIGLGIGTRPGPDGKLGMRMMAWISTVQSLAVVIVTMVICLRCRVSISAIGWSIEHWFRDLRWGGTAFILMAPPIYLLMIAATLLSGQKYNHPIHEMASKDPWMLGPAIWMAVILAPVGEEFVFRVLFQGFLESMSVGRFSIEKFFFGRNRLQPVESDQPPLAAVDPVASSEFDSEAASLPWWPVLVSGILFGLAHFEYGMSWIPLSVLGIALGWLYRVTNRIWPSLVVHFCINATSMIGLSLTVLYGDPTKALP